MSANNWEWAGPPDSVAEHLAACLNKRDARTVISMLLKIQFLTRVGKEYDNNKKTPEIEKLEKEMDWLIGMQNAGGRTHLQHIRQIIQSFYSCDDFWFVQYESETERYSGVIGAPRVELALCRAYASLQYPSEEWNLEIDSEDAFWRHFELEYGHLIYEVENSWLRINNVWVRRDGTAFDYKNIPKIAPDPLDQTDEV